MKFFCL